MTEEEMAQKSQRVMARVSTEAWTPMIRFAFLDWKHGDYEALDARLRFAAVSTRRLVLPEDDGILVGSGREVAPPGVSVHARPPDWAWPRGGNR